MTFEQLTALMEWAKASAQLEAELRQENPDPQGVYAHDVTQRAQALCQAFGFEVGWDGMPKP